MEKIGSDFSYSHFTGRNIGFLSQSEQDILRQSSVLICGVGGMGGACLESLVRAGVNKFIITDIDTFEISNLNRQVFATLKTIGLHKADASKAEILLINPDADITVYAQGWLEKIEEILSQVDIVINGTDDVGASVQLYRAARKHGLVVVDSYAASLPSVYVTYPRDPAPEERIGYATKGKAPEFWTSEDLRQAFTAELEYVMAVSSTRRYIDLAIGAEVAAGKRSRMSLAPMVITAGNLMAYEAINNLLNKGYGTDCRGYFLNPYTCKIERQPAGAMVAILRWVARKYISRLVGKT